MRPTRPLSLLLFSLAALAVPQSALGADAAAIVEAFDIPSDSVLEATTSGLYDQSVIAAQLGPIVAIDDDMALLTTGYASQVQTGVDHDLGTTGIDPTEPSSPVFDPALLELVLVVPDGMHSIQFDWYFLSREYPVYVGSDFNDRFTVIQTGALFDGNIVFNSTTGTCD